MAKYIANPVEVDAFIIKEVDPADVDTRKTRLYLDEIGHRYATADMTARMTPVPGDYFVVQSDGYVYLNPKEVFERKYHLKGD